MLNPLSPAPLESNKIFKLEYHRSPIELNNEGQNNMVFNNYV